MLDMLVEAQRSMWMELGPVQVHLVPLRHLPDRDDSLHNRNQVGCGLRCPMCSRITNQCQGEKKVQRKLALHSWTWGMFVCRVCVSWLKKLKKEMCASSRDLLTQL